MARLTAKELISRDAKRNIAAEVRRGMKEVRGGITAAQRVHHFDVSEVTRARTRVGLSQQKFADMLGVSTRTLQEWEQGRRKPSGAARVLLMIAARQPEVLREVSAD